VWVGVAKVGNRMNKMTEINFFSGNIFSLMKELESFLRCGESGYFSFCDTHLFLRGCEESSVFKALKGAQYVMADGLGVFLLGNIYGINFKERIRGPDFMLKFMSYGVRKGYKHYLFGGVNGAASKAKANLEKIIPGVEIIGTFEPPFGPFGITDRNRVKNDLRGNPPDFFWVGLGSPKQDLWMFNNMDLLAKGYMLGVGAAFDFVSGERPRAPKFIQKIGLEWGFRMVTGGKRVFFRNLRYETKMTILLIKEFVRVCVLKKEPVLPLKWNLGNDV